MMLGDEPEESVIGYRFEYINERIRWCKEIQYEGISVMLGDDSGIRGTWALNGMNLKNGWSRT